MRDSHDAQVGREERQGHKLSPRRSIPPAVAVDLRAPSLEVHLAPNGLTRVRLQADQRVEPVAADKGLSVSRGPSRGEGGELRALRASGP